MTVENPRMDRREILHRDGSSYFRECCNSLQEPAKLLQHLFYFIVQEATAGDRQLLTEMQWSWLERLRILFVTS